MPWFRFKALYGALAAMLLMLPAALRAQSDSACILTVTDSHGSAIAAASVSDASGHLLGHTDSAGHISLPCHPANAVQIEARGFAAKSLERRCGRNHPA